MQTDRLARLAADLHLLTDALLHGHGLAPYYAHWDNADDTTVEGALAINGGSGEVRVVSRWQPA